ncbi:hypothetical protein ACQPZF_10475 [Actinosynnema sp. CS-041913]|uniref:hypothetical protein n=1 Tax=Actinosynnema sp. CS-041913 TaxID=3239917 RepID=UPI003D89DC80
MVKELPEFDAAIAVKVLERLRTALEGIDRILSRLPQMSSPPGDLRDDEFRVRYLDRVARSYDRLEVVGITTAPRPTSRGPRSRGLSESDSDQRRRTRSSHAPAFDWRELGRALDTNLRVEEALGDSRLTLVRDEAGAGKWTGTPVRQLPHAAIAPPVVVLGRQRGNLLRELFDRPQLIVHRTVLHPGFDTVDIEPFPT